MRKNCFKKISIGLTLGLASIFSVIYLSSCDSMMKDNDSEVDNNFESTTEVICDEQGLIYELLDDNTYGVRADSNKCVSEITIPNTYNDTKVTRILQSGFSSCYNLTKVVIPDSITTIENYAFNYSSIQTINIPDSMISIGERVFYECNNLEYNEYDNALYLGNDTNPYLYLVKAKNSNISSCIISPTCKYIMSYAFLNNNKLYTIDIPKSIISFGYESFCNNIKIIYWGGTLLDWINIKCEDNSEGNYEFCRGNNWDFSNFYIASDNGTVEHNGIKYELLTELNIPEEITTIEIGTFNNFKCITTLTIPKTLTTINAGLKYLNNLTTIYYNGTIDDWFNIKYDGIYSKPQCFSSEITFYILDEFGTIEHNGNKYSLLTDVVVPEGVTSIDANEFYGWKYIESVTIPSSVTSIGDSAFYRCSNLKEIRLSNNLVIINDSAFRIYNSLETSIEKIVIPDSVVSIGNSAFYCIYISKIYYTGSLEKWNNIVIDHNNDGLLEKDLNYDGILDTKIYYYAETKPADTDHSYWHYVNDEIVEW